MTDSINYIVHHVFSPPKLPQKDDQDTTKDHVLCDQVHRCAEQYRDLLAPDQRSRWDPIVRMLENLCTSQKFSVLSARSIEDSIANMGVGDTIALLIRAQNSGIILRKFKNKTIFESFEVSPPAGVVIQAKGKLLCSYPGPAVEVPCEIVNAPYFRKELASFLTQMNVDVLDSAATTTKAGSTVVEERDTADPRYITQLLTGILRGMGQGAEVTRIRKRIGDDVLWKDAKNPWRRSSLWLVIRVALQTTLYEGRNNHIDYKAFMMFLMAKILRNALRAGLSSDLIFCMRAKISRRLYKLGSATPDFVLQEVDIVGKEADSLLQERWLAVRKSQAISPTWTPDVLDIAADTHLSLCNSRDYLEKILRSQSSPPSSYDFNPEHSPRFYDNHAFIQTSPPDSSQADSFVWLADFELSVQNNIDGWVSPNLLAESAFATLAARIDDYSRVACGLYASNPEDWSLMLLTLFELWVALDQLAVAQCPLLRAYSPEVPIPLLESLLLRRSESMKRLSLIIEYLRVRHHSANSGWSIFTNKFNENSFAVRYFKQSESHTCLKSRIEADATAERNDKLVKLQKKNTRYHELMDQARALEHQYKIDLRGASQHKKKQCRKCSLQRTAGALEISVHEWPLSTNPLEAMATVVELDCPTAFGVWRSTTHKILYDICTPIQGRLKSPANPPVRLKSYPGLQKYFVPAQLQRITLASDTKSFLNSHYKTRRIPSDESSVCVNNGLHVRLFDESENIWAADCFSECSIMKRCTFQLPSGPYQNLQYAVDSTRHTSNEVIANQSECHRDINLHEYIAFASLRAGSRLQWLNIARELPARCLSFRREEVHTLLMQAACQIGPLSQDGWEWHAELTSVEFGLVLLNQLNDLMVSIKANWLEAVSMRTIIALTTRLLASADDFGVIDQAYRFLRQTREVTFGWMRELAKKLQDNENEDRIPEYQQCLCEMAATCRGTYDVDPDHVPHLLSSSKDLAVLLECAIVMYDNTPPILSAVPTTFRILLERDRRLSHSLEPVVRQEIQRHREGLDQAITALWPAYRAGTQWRHRSQPNDRWLVSETASQAGQESQRVDLNILQGRLLVNGKPLGRLPQEIVKHPTYLRILGNKILDIIPSDLPGVEFASRTLISGYQVFFALRENDQTLVIRTRRDSRVLELIPHEKLSGDLPKLLVNEYTHWLDLSSHEIELRPLKDLWTSSPANWRIYFSRFGHSTMRKEKLCLLVDIRSPTFDMISSRLKALEYAEYLTVTCPPDSHSLSVDLPRFRLSFFTNSKKQLESQNMPGMMIDENQSSGTMFGLVNQIVLRGKGFSSVEPSRCVIIPFGKLEFKPQGHHTEIKINTKPQRHVLYHKYKIDTQLGRLVGNVSLISKLYKVYLHATSSHCLPDDLTGYTGTEEALRELRSSSCQSFQNLTAVEIDILRQISSLTPGRTFYPAHKKVMQTVNWSELAPMAQHHGFRAVSNTIFEHATRLQLFQDIPSADIGLSESGAHLVERAARRTAIYYPEELAILPSSDNGDVEYTSRDLSLGSESTVFGLSALVHRWPSQMDTSRRLFDIVKEWRHLSGPQNNLSLSYSRDWLDVDLPKTWISLYNLCRKSVKLQNRYQLVFNLCSFGYGSGQYLSLIPTLLAFATIPRFRDLHPPSWTSYDLSDGFQPQKDRLTQMARSSAIVFENSPSVHIPASWEENSVQLGRRRLSHYNTQLNSQVPAVVDILMAQWPCEVPYSEPTPSRFPFLNIPQLMTRAGNCFRSWYHNKDLLDHFRKVQVVLDQAYLANLSTRPLYSFVPCLDKPVSVNTFISFDDLIKREAPQLSRPPTGLGVDSVLRDWHASAHSPPCGNGQDAAEPVQPLLGLRTILSEFQRSPNAFHTLYGNDLADSQQALCNQAHEVAPDRIPYSMVVLVDHRDQCAAHLRKILQSISQTVLPSNPIETVMFTAGLWPRITTKSLLGKLTFTHYTHLPVAWQQVVISFAQGLLLLQRSYRLIELALLPNHEDFLKELKNTMDDGSDATQNPDWLLIQVDSNFYARPIQVQFAKEMITPSSGQNSVFQLNMGEGKSSVIVPLVAAVLADGRKLARVFVLKALAGQMFRLLVERLSGLANRQIFYMPFSRTVQVGVSQAQLIQNMYEDCMRIGGVLVVQPEHILSFKLMGIDRLLCSTAVADENVAKQLLKSQKWLERKSRDILDESDEILHVRYQLVYTVGQQQPLEHHPDRWTTIQQVLSLVKKHSLEIQSRFPLGAEVGESHNGSFPAIRLLQVDAGVNLISLIAEDILDGALANCSFALFSEHLRQVAFDFIQNVTISTENAALIKEHCRDSNSWKSLLLLRGLLGRGILVYAMKERRWRVDYGLDFSRSLLAVPYRAKDVPALRAEFGHPDVAITLTCLSYYYQGLSDEQVDLCFQCLFKLDNPTMEYEHWIRAGGSSVPQILHQLSGVNIRDAKQRETLLMPLFRRNQAVVDFYLAQIVFPKEAKEFPEKLATSGWDIAESKTHATTGFSGTNDNQYLLPTSIVQRDPLQQLSTNAKVLTYILQPENDHYLCSQSHGDPRPSAESLLKLLVRQTPEIRVLLDVGAQILEMRNFELVKYWLSLRSDVEAAIFFDDNDDLTVLTQDGVIEAFISSPFNQQLDKCLVYLDDVHTRGTDLKLPRQTRAAVTLGPKVTKDRLLQGCMRMRKLGFGQTVVFLAPLEVDQRIREAADKASSDRIRSLDVLRWAMKETCAEILHHVSHWAQQGVDYLRRQQDWLEFSKTADVSVLKSSWLQPEARTLEFMYGITPTSGLNHVVSKFPEIHEQCQRLGVSSLPETRMEEEQEREVIHEIERERQVERPPKARAATHEVHQRVREFVRTGTVLGQSTEVLSPFSPIRVATTARRVPDAKSSDLLVTRDFLATIQGPAHSTGDYLRAVHWICSSTPGSHTILVVLSPYEVNELLPDIRRSKSVHLHQYTPKVMQAMISFDDLKFYCIPPLPESWVAPTTGLVQELNLFAGQLYLPDHDEYWLLCMFLGVYTKELQAVGDFVIQSDGFIKPEHRRGAMKSLCPFRTSPLPYLKELIGQRRKGMSYSTTHLGKVLYARTLTKEDFVDF